MEDKLEFIEEIRIKNLKRFFTLSSGTYYHAENDHHYNGDGEYVIVVKKKVPYGTDKDERYEIGVGV